MKLAVYGTLKKGFGNDVFLKNSKFISSGKTKEKYAMYRNRIPYVTKDEISNISVEIYEVDKESLKLIDSLEGHPNWYKREPIQIVLDNGAEDIAELYFMELTDVEKHYLKLVEDGNYA